MSNKYERPFVLRFIGSISAFSLMAATLYVIFSSFNLISTLILISAFGGLAGQAMYFGESFFECMAVFFEILVESIAAVFEAVASMFSF
jgi:hypothetical protein